MTNPTGLDIVLADGSGPLEDALEVTATVPPLTVTPDLIMEIVENSALSSQLSVQLPRGLRGRCLPYTPFPAVIRVVCPS